MKKVFLISLLLTLTTKSNFYESPLKFLKAERIDIAAKLIFVKSLDLNLKTNWPRQIYLDHLKAWNQLKEVIDKNAKKNLPHYYCSAPYENKTNADDFINSFKKLFHSLKKGFDSNKSIIPIGKGNIPLDGGHRLAASIYFDQDVTCKYFDHNGTICTFDLLKNKGFKESQLNAIAYEYIKFKPNIYAACLFSPCSDHHYAEQILNNIGNIFYTKEIHLTKTGTYNFIRMLYYADYWKSLSDDFVYSKAHNCFKHQPYIVKIIFFECSNLIKTKEAKKLIRQKMKSYDAIHINDTKEETLSIAQTVLIKNSLHFINFCKEQKEMFNFENLFKKLKYFINKKNLNTEKFCIDASAVMAAYGLRDCNDIDILHHQSLTTKFTPPEIESHNNEAKYYPTTIDDIIFNPNNHFYFSGIKFASLNMIYQMKSKRNEPKDKSDLLLIKSVI